MLLEYRSQIINTDNVFTYNKYDSQGKSYNIRFYSVNKESAEFMFLDEKSRDYCYERIKQLITCITFKDEIPPEQVHKPADVNDFHTLQTYPKIFHLKFLY